MAAVKGRNTAPEMLVRRALHAAGLRFRLHRMDLPGRPDIVLPRYRTVVLVHGCFWHRHNCRFFVWPRTLAGFWRERILANVARDKRNRAALRTLGWKVETVWECTIHGTTLATLAGRIRDGN